MNEEIDEWTPFIEQIQQENRTEKSVFKGLYGLEDEESNENQNDENEEEYNENDGLEDEESNENQINYNVKIQCHICFNKFKTEFEAVCTKLYI